MRRLLVLLFLVTSLHAATYRDEKCGIEFELPKGWTAADLGEKGWQHERQKKDVRCDVGIQPKGWETEAKESDGFLEPYAIELLVLDRPFLETARLAFFRIDETWFISSRGREERAEELETACCQGVRGSGWSRVWNEKGDVGSKTYDIVVLNDHAKRSVFIETQVAERFEVELNGIVDTFRFTR